MRIERAGDRPFALALATLAFVLLAGAGAALDGLRGGLAGGALGLPAAAGMRRLLGARARRRRQAVQQPFPERWRALLLERYDHYDRLPEPLKRRFEDDVKLFLAEKRISGVGVEVTDELRLLVAASAVTLSLGWPDHDWDQLSEVLLYPQDFDRDYSFEQEELAGQTHPWGTVILSVPALHESFEDPDDAYHVGLHEFAHLLDVEQTEFDGIPAGLPASRHAEWVALARKEMERLQRRKSVLDPYGADDPVEFLAVAVEAFFEPALELRRRHRELYEMLVATFGQDPAAWDDQRGLAL
ncbi:MAG: zinc-dependent peptidase [Vicinamibacteria bacterium]